MKLRSLHIAIVLLFINLPFVNGQIGDDSRALKAYKEKALNTKSFDKEHWEQIVNDVDYSEIVQKKKEKKERERESRGSSSTSSPSDPWFTGDGKFLAFFGKLMLIIIAIVFITILLMHLFGNNIFSGPKNTRILTKDGQIDIENIEENMHEIELSDPIQLAIKRGEYDTAVRLYYIAVIKELSIKKLINWKKDKTNRDYYNELTGQSVQPSFFDMTNIYERIWYGSKSLERSDFQPLENRFQQVIRSIQQTTKLNNG